MTSTTASSFFAFFGSGSSASSPKLNLNIAPSPVDWDCCVYFPYTYSLQCGRYVLPCHTYIMYL
jgi:hypothetical protein